MRDFASLGNEDSLWKKTMIKQDLRLEQLRIVEESYCTRLREPFWGGSMPSPPNSGVFMC